MLRDRGMNRVKALLIHYIQKTRSHDPIGIADWLRVERLPGMVARLHVLPQSDADQGQSGCVFGALFLLG